VPPPPPAAPKANAKGAATAQAAAKAKAQATANAKAKAKATAQAKARAKAKARTAAARRAKLARERARVNRKRFERAASPPTPPALSLAPQAEVDLVVPVKKSPKGEQKRDLLTSPLVRVLLLAAALLALVSMALAALPLGALERLLAAEAHYRTEQIANFVDGHRLDIAVAGVATLLVAAVVALPTVTG
jgi:hypothetical protein